MQPASPQYPNLVEHSGINTSSLYIAIIVIIFAIFNPILRPAAEIGITPYYVVFPIIFIWIFIEYNKYRKYTIFATLVLTYSFFAGYLNGTPWQPMLLQGLKYWELWTFFGLLGWIKISYENGTKVLTNVAYACLYSVFAIASVQAIFGFEIPTVINEESYLWINTFFYTPNDLALFLGGMICIIVQDRKNLMTKAVFVFLIFGLNLRNDSKAIMIAGIIVLAVFYILRLAQTAKIRLFYILPFSLLILYPLSVAGLNWNIEVYETSFDVYELFIDPIDRIINFDPYNLGGSIYDRTDALIYSVEALSRNHFLGLGPGGTVYLLSMSNFELLTAKSVHNAIAEFVVEFGFVGLIVCVLGLGRPIVKTLRSVTPNRFDAVKVAFFVAIPFFAVSQSSGFISNYAFWLTAFLIWTGRAEDVAHRRSIVQPQSIGLPNRSLKRASM